MDGERETSCTPPLPMAEDLLPEQLSKHQSPLVTAAEQQMSTAATKAAPDGPAVAGPPSAARKKCTDASEDKSKEEGEKRRRKTDDSTARRLASSERHNQSADATPTGGGCSKQSAEKLSNNISQERDNGKEHHQIRHRHRRKARSGSSSKESSPVTKGASGRSKRSRSGEMEQDSKSSKRREEKHRKGDDKRKKKSKSRRSRSAAGDNTGSDENRKRDRGSTPSPSRSHSRRRERRSSSSPTRSDSRARRGREWTQQPPSGRVDFQFSGRRGFHQFQRGGRFQGFRAGRRGSPGGMWMKSGSTRNPSTTGTLSAMKYTKTLPTISWRDWATDVVQKVARRDNDSAIERSVQSPVRKVRPITPAIAALQDYDGSEGEHSSKSSDHERKVNAKTPETSAARKFDDSKRREQAHDDEEEDEGEEEERIVRHIKLEKLDERDRSPEKCGGEMKIDYSIVKKEPLTEEDEELPAQESRSASSEEALPRGSGTASRKLKFSCSFLDDLSSGALMLNPELLASPGMDEGSGDEQDEEEEEREEDDRTPSRRRASESPDSDDYAANWETEEMLSASPSAQDLNDATPTKRAAGGGTPPVNHKPIEPEPVVEESPAKTPSVPPPAELTNGTDEKRAHLKPRSMHEEIIPLDDLLNVQNQLKSYKSKLEEAEKLKATLKPSEQGARGGGAGGGLFAEKLADEYKSFMQSLTQAPPPPVEEGPGRERKRSSSTSSTSSSSSSSSSDSSSDSSSSSASSSSSSTSSSESEDHSSAEEEDDATEQARPGTPPSATATEGREDDRSADTAAATAIESKAEDETPPATPPHRVPDSAICPEYLLPKVPTPPPSATQQTPTKIYNIRDDSVANESTESLASTIKPLELDRDSPIKLKLPSKSRIGGSSALLGPEDEEGAATDGPPADQLTSERVDVVAAAAVAAAEPKPPAKERSRRRSSEDKSSRQRQKRSRDRHDRKRSTSRHRSRDRPSSGATSASPKRKSRDRDKRSSHKERSSPSRKSERSSQRRSSRSPRRRTRSPRGRSRRRTASKSRSRSRTRYHSLSPSQRRPPSPRGGRSPPSVDQRRTGRSRRRYSVDREWSTRRSRSPPYGSRRPPSPKDAPPMAHGSENQIDIITSTGASPNVVHSPVTGYKKSLADSTISDAELENQKRKLLAYGPAAYYGHPLAGDGAMHMMDGGGASASMTGEGGDESSPKRISLDDRINIVFGMNGTSADGAGGASKASAGKHGHHGHGQHHVHHNHQHNHHHHHQQQQAHHAPYGEYPPSHDMYQQQQQRGHHPVPSYTLPGYGAGQEPYGGGTPYGVYGSRGSLASVPGTPGTAGTATAPPYYPGSGRGPPPSWAPRSHPYQGYPMAFAVPPHHRPLLPGEMYRIPFAPPSTAAPPTTASTDGTSAKSQVKQVGNVLEIVPSSAPLPAPGSDGTTSGSGSITTLTSSATDGTSPAEGAAIATAGTTAQEQQSSVTSLSSALVTPKILTAEELQQRHDRRLELKKKIRAEREKKRLDKKQRKERLQQDIKRLIGSKVVTASDGATDALDVGGSGVGVGAGGVGGSGSGGGNAVGGGGSASSDEEFEMMKQADLIASLSRSYEKSILKVAKPGNATGSVTLVKKSVLFADGMAPGDKSSTSADEAKDKSPTKQSATVKQRKKLRRQRTLKVSGKKRLIDRLKLPELEQESEEVDPELENLPPPSAPPGSPPPELLQPRCLNPPVVRMIDFREGFHGIGLPLPVAPVSMSGPPPPMHAMGPVGAPSIPLPVPPVSMSVPPGPVPAPVSGYRQPPAMPQAHHHHLLPSHLAPTTRPTSPHGVLAPLHHTHPPPHLFHHPAHIGHTTLHAPPPTHHAYHHHHLPPPVATPQTTLQPPPSAPSSALITIISKKRTATANGSSSNSSSGSNTGVNAIESIVSTATASVATAVAAGNASSNGTPPV